MTVLERIKTLCREKKNISITTLEQTLGYSNGSLSKAKDIPGSRIREISAFFNVSCDYLLTGKKHDFSVETADIDTKLIFCDKNLKEYFIKLSRLSKDDIDYVIKMIDRLSEE